MDDINKNNEINELNKTVSEIEDKVNELIGNIKSIENYNNLKSFIEDIIININATKEKINEIISLNQQAIQLTDTISKLKDNSEVNFKKIDQITTESVKAYNDTNKKIEELTKQYSADIKTFNDNINNSEDIIAEVTKLNTSSLKLNEDIKVSHTNATSLQNKIIQIHKESLNYMNQISDLYDEIYGYEYNDETTDELIQKEGLRQKLENSYKQLEQKNESLSKTIDDTVEKAIKDTNDKLTNFMDTQNNKYENLFAKIENLLPSALTAGLASAYGEKRKNEEESLKKYNNFFMISIGAAICAALIPFGISYHILQTATLQETISYIPKLMTFLIPVYIPIIWIATHFNKQIKLSKRLIEEYTHKEVLNKTFEGLAKQIDQLDISSENYNELRSKLLYNIIEMTAHNPGQLIKGFEHTDHPLIEVLNKITQSEESLDKLQNIPGISVIIDMLQARINKKKQNTNQEIADLIQKHVEDKTDK